MIYFDSASSGYVTLLGRARVVRDAEEKAAHWKDAWSSLYKDKNRGEDYVLIRVAHFPLPCHVPIGTLRPSPQLIRVS